MRIDLRLCGPYILSAAVFVLLFCLSSSGAPALLRLQLYSSQIMVAFQTDLSGGEAMATGMPLVLLAVFAVVAQGWIHGRRRFTARQGASRRFPLSLPGKALAACACAAILALAAGVPLAVLIGRAGGIQAFRTALTEMRSDILHSLTVAAAAATAAAAVGAWVGYLSVRVRGGRALEILTILPYAAPASVVGAGLLALWDRPGWPGALYVSGAVIALAGFTRFIPFSVLPSAAAVRGIDPLLEEAAVVHGVPWVRRVTSVILPLGFRGFLAAWILVFVLTLGELDAAILVVPAGITTVPVRIFNAIHFGRTEVVSALCLLLVFVSALPLAVYSLLTSRKIEVL